MHILSRGAYRSWQVWQALWARPLSAEAQEEISTVLTAGQMALFEEQSAAGQQHGYRVMRTLINAGHNQDDLMVAALLHDVGKNRNRYTWLDRVKVVLAQRFTPKLARQWSAGPERGWRRAFVVKAAHAQWGAEALAGAGCSDLSVALVRRHHEAPINQARDGEENGLLALLQWADDRN